MAGDWARLWRVRNHSHRGAFHSSWQGPLWDRFQGLQDNEDFGDDGDGDDIDDKKNGDDDDVHGRKLYDECWS